MKDSQSEAFSKHSVQFSEKLYSDIKMDAAEIYCLDLNHRRRLNFTVFLS